MSQGSQGDDAPAPGVSDAHLADRAAYGDAGAFATLADRFRGPVWTTAALASGDRAIATRATAAAFTRTLAARAAGIGDLDAPVGPALATTAYELARETHPDAVPDPVALPAPLAGLDPEVRTAAWLTEAEGWAPDAVAELLRAGAGLTAVDPEAPTWSPAAAAAARGLALDPTGDLVAAAATGWREWQGLEVAIPDRHPLSIALARLDAPLGRVGAALGRLGSQAATAAARRRRRLAAVAPVPPAPMLPADDGASDDEVPAGDVASPLTPVGPAGEEVPAGPTSDAVAVSMGVSAPSAPGAAVVDDGPDLGPEVDHLALPERDRSVRHLVTAGATSTRLRVVAAVAAGILTASAAGSLLATDPTAGRARPSGATEAAVVTGEDGALLDDGRPVVPVVATEAAPPPTTTDVPGPSVSSPAGPGAPASGAGASGTPAVATPNLGAPSEGGGAAPRTGGQPSGGGGDGAGAPTSPAPAPTPVPTPVPGPPPNPTPAPTPTAPPTTAPPTTAAPAPTTTPPGPTTTAPPSRPVCTLLPVLCP